MKKISFMLLAVMLLVSCAKSEPEPQPYRMFRDDLMGTFMSITAHGEGAQEAVHAAFEQIELLHNVVSRIYDGETIEDWTSYMYNRLLEQSQFVYEETNGAFNHQLRPLIELWGIGTEHERVPSQAEIDEALAQSGYDFGAIAKGYAAETAVFYMRNYRIEGALIELGGDIVAWGTRPDGAPWRIGLRSPLGDGAVIGTIELSGSWAMMTSGSYERYFEQDGIRYHHIFDPATGYPADSGLLSVTVMFPDHTQADAYSTAFFVMGIEDSSEIIRKWKLMSAIFITEDLDVHLVGEFAQAFNLTDDRFRIV